MTDEIQNAFMTNIEPEKPSVPMTLEFLGDVWALMTAIAKAQGQMDEVIKSTEGQVGHIKFRYAPLSVLRTATKAALAAEEIVVMQFLVSSPTVDGWHRLTTVIGGHNGMIRAHADFDPSLKLDADDRGDLKTYGKRTTYLRRYHYQAIFMLDGEEDADSDPNSLPGPGKKAPTKRPSARANGNTPPDDMPPPVGESANKYTEEQQKRMRELCKKAGIITKDGVVKKCKEICQKGPNDFTVEDADKFIREMEKQLPKPDNGEPHPMELL